MRLEPLNQWICDVCHHVIKRPEDGWLEWQYTQESPSEADLFPTRRMVSIRIVHRFVVSPLVKIRDLRFGDPGCQYSREERGGELMLTEYVGSDGLSCLIGMLTKGLVADVENWADIVRRLHIPYYEEARQYLVEAEDDGCFEGVDPEDYYHHDKLKWIIRKYGG